MADSEVQEQTSVADEQSPMEETTTDTKIEQNAEVENGGGGDTPSESAPSQTDDGKKSADADSDEDDDEDERKLFVGGLSKETDEASLKAFMVEYGEVTSCIIKTHRETKESRCFGFVVFKEVAGLEKALDGRPHNVDGRKIDSKKAQPQVKPEIKLFVGGVKPETDETTIKAYFSKYGEVVKIDRPKEGGKDGKFKAFCFVTFKKNSSVAKATKDRYQKLDDKDIECKEADPPRQGGNRPQGRGRGGGRGGYPFMGGPGYGFPPYSPYDMGFFGFGPGYGGMPYPGYGGGGYGYGQQNQSSFGKSGRGGRNARGYKPY